ncbi:MAG: dihydrodipicolinate synthase family protein [Gemmatimonadetes bacterium]|jgi:dihydrodipicolinate synthase/N-acetylneuraminate lyase|nr:dihydrodipicolinate synthase family protein [Gemmatimonadota bacterium]MBT6146014.1 dihydrodipicolinate synthase family protein [Gemmatimonadota bacterium]MBT7863819.1 dihydrodipicolinate synthase family protein [Gemmatimonadota bacterium]
MADAKQTTSIRATLKRGLVIPAHPLALDAQGKLDERRQRALSRYYIDSGAGGLAVGVHTTQFEIRQQGLLRPVLQMAMDVVAERGLGSEFARIAGAIGPTPQAVEEAILARDCGYDACLLSLAALGEASDDELIAHCTAVAAEIPVVGFYLQPAVGGRFLGFDFWRRFAAIPDVVAIKMAPFNRYQTLDVLRGVAASGRADEVALYTGNDDNIVLDLLTVHRVAGADGEPVDLRITGGLLGHWAVWTQKAVELLAICHDLADGEQVPAHMLTRAIEVTDSNAAFFDAENGFAGCIAGIHEVLRRQGLLESIRCLNPAERLSAGQAEEIDRVYAAYPHLNDDAFVAEHLEEWLAPASDATVS